MAYHMRMSHSYGTRGFTLIELLVVIAIIGILSSVVLASLNTGRQKSRDARRISDVKQIQTALELFNSNCNSYPATLTTASTATGCPSGITLGSFLTQIPMDPQSGSAYVYAGLGGSTCTSFHLGAIMETGASPGINADADAGTVAICTGSAADFLGVSVACNAVAGGTPAPAGTERCYDIKP